MLGIAEGLHTFIWMLWPSHRPRWYRAGSDQSGLQLSLFRGLNRSTLASSDTHFGSIILWFSGLSIHRTIVIEFLDSYNFGILDLIIWRWPPAFWLAGQPWSWKSTTAMHESAVQKYTHFSPGEIFPGFLLFWSFLLRIFQIHMPYHIPAFVQERAVEQKLLCFHWKVSRSRLMIVDGLAACLRLERFSRASIGLLATHCV